MPFEQTLIFGAGALGSWLGARIEPRAVLVARGEHARAMRERGLVIRGVESATVPVTVADGCADLGPGALVIVAVKMGGLEAAAGALAPHLRDDTVVAVLANGLAPDAELGAALGRRVVRIVAEFGATLDEPGVVSAWGGRAVLGPGADEDRVAAALEPTGLTIARVDDLRRVAWDKLALNCVANPLAALTSRRNRDLITDELKDLRRAVALEVMTLAAVEGVDLADDTPERIDAVLARSHNFNSMAQDIRYGRPTEIEHINGLVARMCAERGLPAPANRWLAEMVRLRERFGES